MAQGVESELAQQVEACRQRSVIQKRMLEREMEVWQIVDEQNRAEGSRAETARSFGAPQMLKA